MAKAILDFETEGLKKLHFLVGGLNFPVVAATYNDWENQQISCMEGNFKSGGFTTKSVCEWCIHHKIQYRIVYPVSIVCILRNPYKYLKYLQLKKELGYFC